jgi:anaerobic selenocysteine-containing dehydrogenase
MNRYMIEEDLYDHEYVTNYTVAPFLVREDNGKFLRESDIKAGGDPEKYVFWNKLPAEARVIGARMNDFHGLIPDLNARLTVHGIPCKAAFLKLREHLRSGHWSVRRN